MTTRSDSGHCIAPTKTSIARDRFVEESESTLQVNSEMDRQIIHTVSSSETEAITVDDGAVSPFLEDGRGLGRCSEIFKEGEQFGDDVHMVMEVDDTDGALLSISEIQGFEKESIEPNGKESLNSEEKEQESEVQRLLEAEKRRLLAEIEVGSIFRKRADVDTLARASDVHKLDNNGNGSKEQNEMMEIVEVKDNAFAGKTSVDDTAMVDVVPFCNKGEDHPKRPATAQTDKDAPRKHKKIGEKPVDGKKDKGNASKVVEGNGENIGKQFGLMYSRKQLESMRFAHFVNQKKLWSEMYARLLPEVVTEYESFVSLKNQKTSKSNLVRRKPIPTESGIGENLGTEEGTEDLTPEDYTKDNDDYNSILRPAFAVDGEPDFSTGPPEDGLEYLRRVRWEAKGIPNVKVAKIDESKYRKKEQSVYMPQIPEIPKCPEHFLPVKEWEDSLLSDFTHLCLALSQNANGLEDEMIPSESIEDLLVEIFNKRLHTERDDESFGGVISDIQGMDSVTRISRLKKRICLVEKESGLLSSDCKWVVAFSASLETPLDADTSACLRGLLRKCASVRAEKSLEVGDEEEVIVMANMLITIAGRYFGQMGQ